ncbi:glutathionylspermidine synthase family protein [Hymenobacter swuensis]|uniref:Putative glutathionylspermidine synthase n=1 Tax=Hymenobacter swuensis DY53 TaxID=1227739 RepID=W8F2Q6_9BACT|nr:glutathionylspermidine synthase family protein [Hymenobacter swuensis]AHJ96866.1 putative glutathionylspermidine synthase [Hymenobacter swuensis DY53]
MKQTPTIELVPLAGNVEPAIRELGWDWAVEDACENYVAREAVRLPEATADELLEAADTLYELLLQSIPDPIPDTLLQELAIPELLWEAVRHSWNDDRHWHLYGRFDLASTPEGPKLIEFNADTATSIPETAVIQWASLMAAGLADDDRQANGLFEGVQAQFAKWRDMNSDLEPCLLLIHLPDSSEDATNCAVLAEAAREAGFQQVHVCSADAMQVALAGDERGVWAQTGPEQWQRFSFLCKLVPWELLAEEEPDLTRDLTELLRSRDLIIANPAYTLLFQSKVILAWLWQCFPHHPLLLEASLGELPGHQVRKPVLGREGQDVTELGAGSPVAPAAAGDYAGQRMVYQRFAELPTDVRQRQYQAGVFWAGSSCAIGFRREQGIITNLSEFVPHLLA